MGKDASLLSDGKLDTLHRQLADSFGQVVDGEWRVARATGDACIYAGYTTERTYPIRDQLGHQRVAVALPRTGRWEIVVAWRDQWCRDGLGYKYLTAGWTVFVRNPDNELVTQVVRAEWDGPHHGHQTVQPHWNIDAMMPDQVTGADSGELVPGSACFPSIKAKGNLLADWHLGMAWARSTGASNHWLMSTHPLADDRATKRPLLVGWASATLDLVYREMASGQRR